MGGMYHDRTGIGPPKSKIEPHDHPPTRSCRPTRWGQDFSDPTIEDTLNESLFVVIGRRSHQSLQGDPHIKKFVRSQNLKFWPLTTLPPANTCS